MNADMTCITKTDKRVHNAANLPRVFPVELGANIDGIAPSGLCIMSACLIVEKMAVAVCDGRDKWYMRAEDGTVKSISAGQPWSDLFA